MSIAARAQNFKDAFVNRKACYVKCTHLCYLPGSLSENSPSFDRRSDYIFTPS